MARSKDRYAHKHVINGNSIELAKNQSVKEVVKAISKITKDKKGVRWDFSFMGDDAAKLQAVAEAKGITSQFQMKTKSTPTRRANVALPDGQWLKTPEACVALKISRSTLQDLVKKGLLTAGQHYVRLTTGLTSPQLWNINSVREAMAQWSAPERQKK